MITARQAREGTYNKVALWMEKKLQPEIELSLFKHLNQASRLFTDDEVNPEELKTMLEEELEYRVVLTNMTEKCGFKCEHSTIYNVTVYW